MGKSYSKSAMEARALHRKEETARLDGIRTKASNDPYRTEYERIFGKRKRPFAKKGLKATDKLDFKEEFFL